MIPELFSLEVNFSVFQYGIQRIGNFLGEAAMSRQSSRRGRPRGSGLDDRKHLEAISRLISKDPELKPTTAIKSLGITNPSTIRRLRDKFNTFQNSAEAELEGCKKTPALVAPAREGSASRPAQGQGRLPAASNSRTQEIPAELCASAAAKGKDSHGASDGLASADPVDPPLLSESARWLGMLCEIGIQSMSAAWTINTSACRTLVTIPQVRWACHNQLALNQMWLEMMQRATHPASATVH